MNVGSKLQIFDSCRLYFEYIVLEELDDLSGWVGVGWSQEVSIFRRPVNKKRRQLGARSSCECGVPSGLLYAALSCFVRGYVRDLNSWPLGHMAATIPLCQGSLLRKPVNNNQNFNFFLCDFGRPSIKFYGKLCSYLSGIQ